MSEDRSIGIERLAALEHYVHDLDRMRRYLADALGFEEVFVSSRDAERASGQRGALLHAGECALLLSAPLGEGGPAWRFLRRHPEGIGALVFEVEDAARAFALVEERGGTPLSELVTHTDEGGELATFSIATPLGDTAFRFVERRGHRAPVPGFVARAAPDGERHGAGAPALCGLDHVTANLRTLSPALLWMEHVLGLERCWEVRFHTGDEGRASRGSGLRSTVMWDPRSGVKIAANEPLRPRFRESQVDRFVERHRGDGVQHAALVTDDIVGTVRALRGRGVSFRQAPRAYFDALPEHLQRAGVGTIEESVEVLRELEILVDGGAPGRYLLQIFLAELAAVFGDEGAGPFFFEIIQRRGDEGFGAGNFRALFEGIEREDRRAG